MRLANICAVVMGMSPLATPAMAFSQKDNADCMRRDDPDRAIDACTRLLKLGNLTKQNRSITYNNRGFGWRAKGDFKRAIADFNEAIQLNPKNTFAFYGRGVAWSLNGEPPLGDIATMSQLRWVNEGYRSTEKHSPNFEPAIDQLLVIRSIATRDIVVGTAAVGQARGIASISISCRFCVKLARSGSECTFPIPRTQTGTIYAGFSVTRTIDRPCAQRYGGDIASNGNTCRDRHAARGRHRG